MVVKRKGLQHQRKVVTEIEERLTQKQGEHGKLLTERPCPILELNKGPFQSEGTELTATLPYCIMPANWFNQ